MRVLEGKVKIELYDSIKEMTAERYKDFQKFLFEMWGVGSTMNDLDSHLVKVYQLIAANKVDEALTELQNLRMSANLIINKVSVSSYVFLSMVRSIDGIEIMGHAESDLAKYVPIIEENMSQEEIEEAIEHVKKKLSLN